MSRGLAIFLPVRDELWRGLLLQAPKLERVCKRIIKGMSFQERRKEKMHAHCPRCGHEQLFVRVKITPLLHLGLTILTFGLWFVCWIALCIGRLVRPWRCDQCGWHKPEFRHIPNQTASSARALPNRDICSTKPIGHMGSLAKCLVDDPAACRHAMGYENGHVCTHPQWKSFFKKEE